MNPSRAVASTRADSWLWDLDAGTAVVPRTVCRRLGIGAPTSRAEPLLSRLDPDDLDALVAAAATAGSGGADSRTVKIHWPMRDGTLVVHVLRVCAETCTDGRPAVRVFLAETA
jgi:hypothetical protein